MGKNYSVTFVSLRSGAAYTVNIGGGTGPAVPLKGAAHPFTTDEDTDEDMFTPVRTQSGYIRIVDDGLTADGAAFDWTDLIPENDTSRPVTLTTANGTVLWQGFMQAQDFGSTLYGNTQVREFPVQCPLSVAGSDDIVQADAPITEARNMAYYLKRILDSVTAKSNGMVSFDYVYVQGGSRILNRLLYTIDPACLVDVNRDENTVEAQYSKLEVLEDICRFLGLTARVHQRSVFFTATNAESSLTRLDMTELSTLSGGTSAGTTVYVNQQPIGDDALVSVDNDVTVLRGYSQATVSSDAGQADKYALKCFPKYVHDEIYDALNFETWTWSGYVMQIFGKATSIDSVDLIGATTNDSWFGVAHVYRVGNRSDDNLVDVVMVNSKYTAGVVLVSLETVYEHNYAGCLLEFNADTYFAGYRLEKTSDGHDYGDYRMKMHVGIGHTRDKALWWNGNSWGSTLTECEMTIGNQGRKLYHDRGSGIYESYVETPKTGGYVGKLFIDLLGTDDLIRIDTDTPIMSTVFALVDFTVSRVFGSSLAGISSTWDDSRKEVTIKNDGMVWRDWNADCIFSSYGDVAYGYGILSEAGGGFTPSNLEHELADRVCNPTTGYWRTSKLAYRLELDATQPSVSALTPRSEATMDGHTFYVAALGRDWWDDIVKPLLIEK